MKWNDCSSKLKKKKVLIACGCVALMFTHINASAKGFGIYGSTTNSGDADWDNWNNSSSVTTGIDRKEYGFVFDTAVAKDKIYNYRLQVGHVEASYYGIKYSGETIINTFGFGIVRTQDLRIWLGPQIGMRVLKSKTQASDNGGIEYGAVIGMNYHVSPSISLTAEAGRRFSLATVNGAGSDYDLKEQRNFVNLGVMYRFNDNF